MKNPDQKSLFSILLVERSQDESKHFIDIVRKEHPDVKIHNFTNSFEAVQCLQQNGATVIVMEEDSQPMSASQTTDYIRQELKLDIPVFITSTASGKAYQNWIVKPFTEESLAPLFIFSAEEDAKEHPVTAEPNIIEAPLYSLDYLKEISGGNSEFIIESLEIFKNSVKNQLQELKIASEEKNNERAAEIAHNIKPSFEMLENQEGTEICNKLTYDLQNHSLTELVFNLKILFEKIVFQLESDFTPKNI